MIHIAFALHDKNDEIKQQLRQYGYIEDENFFEGEKFLTKNNDCYKF